MLAKGYNYKLLPQSLDFIEVVISEQIQTFGFVQSQYCDGDV